MQKMYTQNLDVVLFRVKKKQNFESLFIFKIMM